MELVPNFSPPLCLSVFVHRRSVFIIIIIINSFSSDLLCSVTKRESSKLHRDPGAQVEVLLLQCFFAFSVVLVWINVTVVKKFVLILCGVIWIGDFDLGFLWRSFYFGVWGWIICWVRVINWWKVTFFLFHINVLVNGVNRLCHFGSVPEIQT